jgi:predicted short-subunit dehydrogenase-like oxidoreductase (DUF2520 family)
VLSSETPTSQRAIAIVGDGRIGRALAAALRGAGLTVAGPLGRRYEAGAIAGVEAVLLCVPDREIPAAAASLAAVVAGEGDPRRCPYVGHCSGACTLAALAPVPPGRRFSLHPLMTFAAGSAPRLAGAAAAVAGDDAGALGLARELAGALGLHPVAIAEADRAAYHAAASLASNFLVALELAAERLGASAGLPRGALAPLVRETVENWARLGPGALTGPIARGDAETVARQRDAVARRAPELLELFDALAGATRELGAVAGTSSDVADGARARVAGTPLPYPATPPEAMAA